MDLRAFAPAQNALETDDVRAYVYPRPRSTFKALAGSRLRITQFLRTAPNVRLTARTTFYLGPKNAKTADAGGPRQAAARSAAAASRRPRP